MDQMRLLIADDEPQFAEFVRKVATDLGYSAEVSLDGGAFKAAFDQLDPSVVVLDMVMPEVDGFELIQWLVENKRAPKIILISGFNPSYTKVAKTLGESRGLPSVTTLRKPVRLADLREALTQAAAG